LKIDPSNVKALFRRSAFYEHKKDWDKALADITKCQELSEVEDALVKKAGDRVRKEILKEKSKEKKMWGKAFS
jgi:DNA topoisomerase VI subunit A